MRVVVTGGAGFIGSHLVDALVARGVEVLILDDLSSGEERFLNPAARFEKVDIRSPEAARSLAAFRPDAVSHHAAQISVSVSVRDPLLDAGVNIEGGLNLLGPATAAGSRFVFASSGGQVYGDPSTIPTPESAPERPVSPYGVSKLAFDRYLHAFHRQHGLAYVSLRYSNVYGQRQNPHGEAGVIAILCEWYLGHREFRIHGQGTDTRDYVHVSDVVRANLLAIDSQVTGEFNIGTGRETDVLTLQRLVGAALGIDKQADHGPPRPGDIPRSALDSSLAAKALGWQPQVSLEEGIRQTAAWFASGAER